MTIFKRRNLREVRKEYPDMPDCCQRCQLFMQDGATYREGRLPEDAAYGSSSIVLVDTVNQRHDQYRDYCSVIQCSFPDELRTKEGKIPKREIKYCSQFVKEDIELSKSKSISNEVMVVTDGPAARESIEYLGIDKEQDVIHLQYKSGESNEYAQQRVDWVRNRELVSPSEVPLSSIMAEVHNRLYDKQEVMLGLDFEWDPDDITSPHTIGVAIDRYCAYGVLDSMSRGWLRGMVQQKDLTIVGHDLARAEIQRLFDLGIHDIRCKFEDSMVTTWELMDKAGNVALKDLCYKHLPIENYWFDIDEDSYRTFSPRLGEYCAKDAWASLYYLDELKKEYKEEYEDMEYAHELDMRMLLPTAYAMWKGIGLNGENVHKRLVEAKELIHDYEQYYKELGINPSAPAQVVNYMHRELGIKVKSTDSKLLKAVRDNCSRDGQVFIDQLLEYRNYNTTITRYLTGDLVNTSDGIIHTYMQVAKANTGRPAYSNPNIANIPHPLRDIFESTHRDKGTLVTYDRGQSEFRGIAYLAEDPNLIKAFMDGVDMHTYVSDYIGIDRTPCKNLNFGYLYGANDPMLLALLREAGVKESSLRPTLSKFKECMSDISEWQEGFINHCYDIGYIPSPYGRRGYRLRPTTIVNYPVQSWSADLNKETLLYFFNRMREEGLESHVWCEFYDGCEIDAVTEELPVIQQIASEVFQELPDILDYGVHLPFPLETEIHGRCWS